MSRPVCIILIGIFSFPGINAYAGEGMWTEDGVIVCNQEEFQFSPAVASNSSGGAIVVWQHMSSGNSICAQRIDASGNVVWSDNGVLICDEFADQKNPAIAPDDGEGAFIVWQSDNDIYAQRVDSSGIRLWSGTTGQSLVICNQGNAQTDPAITPDDSGGAIIVWQDARDGNNDIYAQRINGDGVRLWTLNGLVICNQVSSQEYPAIAPSVSNGAIIVWQDARDGNSDIYAQRIDGNGTRLWTWAQQGVVVCNQGQDQKGPAVAADDSGYALIVWDDVREGNIAIYAQRLESDGNLSWAEQGVVIANRLSYAIDPEIVSDGSGGAIVVWKGRAETIPNPDIYVQRIDPAGNIIWNEAGVAICEHPAIQQTPAITSDGSGGAIMAWWDACNFASSTSSDIYAQRIYHPRPHISGVSPAQGAWGTIVKNIVISGFSMQDVDRGEVTHAKLKRIGEDDVEGRDLRDLNPNSFTCDFDLSSVCEAGDWDIVLYDNLGRTTTAASIWFNVFSPEMQHLTWTSAPAGNLNTGTQNNLAGQINCTAKGYNYLQSMIVENAGTAETGQDIQRLKLWHKTGGSSPGITFDPLTANYLADFTPTSARLWTLGFADQEVMVEDGDALYITADISGGARANRTCCFALPALSVKFKYPNNLPESGIVSNTQQVIAQSVSFYVDFTSLAPVNIAEGQKDVCLGRIKISNATGNEIPVSSILVGLTDRAGIGQGLESVFDRIWIEHQGDRLAEIQAPFSGGNFNLLPQLNLDQDEVVLELGGSIKAVPKVRTFFVGLMHGECLNNGTKLAAAISGKEFPLLTEQINIRGRELKATFSNYPNPFAAGSEGTRISYYLRSQARVEMDVLTLNGDQIKRLADCSQDEGMHETSWDGRNEKGYGVRSGIYLLRIIVNYVNGGKELLVRKVAVAR